MKLDTPLKTMQCDFAIIKVDGHERTLFNKIHKHCESKTLTHFLSNRIFSN